MFGIDRMHFGDCPAAIGLEVAKNLVAESGRDIERRLVETSDAIREPGEYDVTLRLSTDITATVHIMAEAEE